MTASTLALTEFLLDRIAEDEAGAASGAQRKRVHDAAHESLRCEYRCEFWHSLGKAFAAVAPDARIHAECEAKWGIVRLHHPGVDEIGALWCSTCLSPESAYGAPWPCPTLTTLAAIYADHPDYREEWKP